MLRLTLSGLDTLVISPVCARCPSGPAGCCAAPPAVAWTDIGRILDHGGEDWLLAEIESGRLRPCPRGLAIERREGPHGMACTYLGERGCVLPPDRRSVTCNEYLCEDALREAEREKDPSARAARAAHRRLERSLGELDDAMTSRLLSGERRPRVSGSAEPSKEAGLPTFDRVFLGRVLSAFRSLALFLVVSVLVGTGVLALVGCGGLPPAVPRGGAFDAQRLEGGWTVAASNFPMWLEGNKTDPNFIYRVRPGTSPVELDDIVAYTQSGRRDTIEGTDTQDPSAPAHFTWRGNGLLAAFSSDWIVMAHGPDDRWLILYFTKTLVTPEGVDVIVKRPPLSAEDRESIQKLLASDPFLKERSRGLLWLTR